MFDIKPVDIEANSSFRFNFDKSICRAPNTKIFTQPASIRTTPLVDDGLSRTTGTPMQKQKKELHQEDQLKTLYKVMEKVVVLDKKPIKLQNR